MTRTAGWSVLVTCSLMGRMALTLHRTSDAPGIAQAEMLLIALHRSWGCSAIMATQRSQPCSGLALVTVQRFELHSPMERGIRDIGVGVPLLLHPAPLGRSPLPFQWVERPAPHPFPFA